ncbi:MAG: GAF domain-containing protein [Hyphomicrobiaceae bacterium]
MMLTNFLREIRNIKEDNSSNYIMLRLHTMKISRAKDNRRLAALHELGILDSAKEESYDRITRLCSMAFDMPVSAISLVDKNRQWFKSVKGLSVRETPRNCAICNYTIQRGGPLIIEDTTKDDRTKKNPLVTKKKGFRFYAAAPLVLTNGERVGALCVLDRKPRKLGPHQVVTLVRMADYVVRKLELRSSFTQLLWDIEERFDDPSYA